jgi:hypothetical protein
MPKPVPKGSPVTKNWTFRLRRIRGKGRLVKVRKAGGNEQVRMAGVVSTTDKGPRRHIRKV